MDLVFEKNNNLLKRKVSVVNPTHEFTAEFLEAFKQPFDLDLNPEA